MFAIAAGGSAVLTGALLGLTGGLLPLQARVSSATVLSLIAMALGTWELIVGRLNPLQCNRETPQQWIRKGPYHWALRNGIALGIGITTRIGFWIWYVVPVSAFLIGRPLEGAIVYGTYGIVRGATVWPALLLYRVSPEPLGLWLLRHNATARYVSSCVLLATGTLAALVVGL